MMKKEELNKLATKFAADRPKADAIHKEQKLPYKDAFKKLGWTDEELANVQNCPRTGSISSAGTWVKIGGCQTYPLSWALTEEERKEYYKFKGTSSGTRTKVSESDAKVREGLLKAIEELKKLKGSEEVVKQLEAILPPDPEELKLRETLAKSGFSEEQITAIVAMQRAAK